MKKRILHVGLLTASMLAIPALALAVSFEDPSVSIGLGTADLKDTVINIINWILGLLGIIAVIMILVGGFQWMTAAGNEEKVEKAKKIISAAIVGLIIILLAWAIVNFVIGTTSNVSGV
jgi:type IV secretory pathway VirB2 component (pilin)